MLHTHGLAPFVNILVLSVFFFYWIDMVGALLPRRAESHILESIYLFAIDCLRGAALLAKSFAYHGHKIPGALFLVALS